MSADQSPEEFIPEYYEISDVLIAEDSLTTNAGELHGLLCGFLAAGARFKADDWLKQAAELMDIAEYRHESSKLALVDMYHGVLSLLENADFGFQLLLPDDDLAIGQRAEALGAWCQGFLTGFGLQGGQTNASLTEELRETLSDMEQIAQLELDPEENEDSESDLMELHEYVRMAAMMIFSEFNPQQPDESVEPGTTLH